jgi:teichuronic acid biosynthesis glycosyltransferase TuaG
MTVDQPLVSVIIPAYNTGKWLRQCLDSVLAQTYQNWEVLAVYAPSTDNTLEILKDYELNNNHRIILLQEGKKTNVATARNWAIQFSKGKYIAMLDSDDWWEPRKLELMIKLMEMAPYLSWASHSMIEHHPDHDHILDLRPGFTMSIGGTGNVIMRRELLDEIKEKYGYVYNEQMDRNDDADLILRIRKYPSTHSYAPLTHYRIHSDNLTSHTNRWQRLKIITGMAIRNHAYLLIPYHIFLTLLFACGIDPVAIKRRLI